MALWRSRRSANVRGKGKGNRVGNRRLESREANAWLTSDARQLQPGLGEAPVRHSFYYQTPTTRVRFIPPVSDGGGGRPTSTSRPLFLKLLMRWFSKPAFSAMAAAARGSSCSSGFQDIRERRGGAASLLTAGRGTAEDGRNRTQGGKGGVIVRASSCCCRIWTVLMSSDHRKNI